MHTEPREQGPESLAKDILDAIRAGPLVVFTGAGMSAECGIPTFREAQTGLWARFRAEDLATPEAFERDPATVWDWYEWRRGLVRSAEPHPGYAALARLERCVPDLAIVTQNVDGLHRAAGSGRVIELHGNIMRNVCHRTRRPIDDRWLRDHPGRPPASPHHPEGFARPDVVWFGEALPEDALAAAWTAAERARVMLAVGTSGLVQPAASLPLAALRAGALLIEVNPEPTPLSDRAVQAWRDPAGVALPRLVERLQGR